MLLIRTIFFMYVVRISMQLFSFPMFCNGITTAINVKYVLYEVNLIGLCYRHVINKIKSIVYFMLVLETKGAELI